MHDNIKYSTMIKWYRQGRKRQHVNLLSWGILDEISARLTLTLGWLYLYADV